MQNVQQVGGQLTQIIHQVQAPVLRSRRSTKGCRCRRPAPKQISEALLQLTDAANRRSICSPVDPAPTS